MKLTKMSGTGNSFLITNEFGKNTLENKADLAKKLCHKYQTDGFVCLKGSEKLDFEWDFYNMDGSHADMCGNAARCVIMYASKNNLAKNKAEFSAGIREIAGEVIDSKKVKISMGKAHVVKKLKVEGVSGYLVNTGVFHFVIEADDINSSELFDLAKLLQNSNSIVKGNNITFYSSTNVKTFERGICEFTKACGTGAVAAGAVMVFKKTYKFNNNINLMFPGGELVVSIDDEYRDTFLTGEVEFLDTFEHVS